MGGTMKSTFAEKLSHLSVESSAAQIVMRFMQHLKFELGKDEFSATPLDCYLSFASAVRSILLNNWLITQPQEYFAKRKRVYYLSLEYLIGRSLGNAILNLDIHRQSIKALSEMGYDLKLISEIEWDAGLGNGGLGRLAACFLDSLASLKIPAYGYGIRYEYGIFQQSIVNGEQVESPDNWLRYGSIWEIPHPERLFPVHFGGCVKERIREDGSKAKHWIPGEQVMAMAYDYLVPGFQNGYVNTLRLWSAKSSRGFNLSFFNEGDYVQSVADKNHSELISKVLYPNDNNMQGKELRLKQEYFFVCATLQDILRRFGKKFTDYRLLPDKVAIQMNDTHPAIAVAELMRILVDDKAIPWNTAWDITQQCLAYTNHTILPEALEKWQVALFEKVLPRHMQIIYEINQRFLSSIQLSSASPQTIRNLSIIEEEPVKSVRMANLAIIGSHSVNGVSALHTQILKDKVFSDFYKLHPERFNNRTNGITPRRWLMLCNPRLSELITEAIGPAWMNDLLLLSKLNKLKDDSTFLADLGDVKHLNKEEFCQYYTSVLHHNLNPHSIFDFQTKRMHEYKRQLLNALGIIHLIHRIRRGESVVPQSFFFAGKAAPGYFTAKLIIRFICAISAYIQKDKKLSEHLNVIFLPNYRVSLAERIMPAAEVSRQISTAGTEASGTGNMKFALNGALTIGTLDGANIEIRDAVGAENFFLFGMNAQEVQALKEKGYHPFEVMQHNPDIKEIFAFIESEVLSPLQPGLFKPLTDLLLHQGDTYCLIADLADYLRVSGEAAAAYQDKTKWNRMSLANIANMGRFSSDETIKGYAKEIWGVM
ncbi:MAG: glycogen phosphorylase [Candidatus Cloacimonetes bacterium HGW-Cloacimonetes-3]|nr:MAG: glycogen phosphorylase [Candidatus Cloacimonetes bacterium HGW-Cloacimonetes-3]